MDRRKAQRGIKCGASGLRRGITGREGGLSGGEAETGVIGSKRREILPWTSQ